MTRSRQTTDGIEYGGGSDPSRWMTYTYNLSGALTEQQYPSGRIVKNVLDNEGDLSMVQSKKNASFGYYAYASSFTYNAAGAVTSMQLGNGRWESTTFNSRLQPTQLALGVTQGATNLLDLDYEYGATAAVNNGNVTKQTITVPTVGASTGFTAVQNYTYDSLNRLKSAEEIISSQTSWKQTFTFDRYGNRNFDEANTTFAGFDKLCNGNTELCAELRKRLNPSINTSNNRLNTSEDYAFDFSGNTTGDPDDRTFIYDAENKQVKVLDSLYDTIGEYLYDGDGRRIKKYVPATGEVTVFVYDAAGKLIGEYSTIVAASQDAKVTYLTNDHLGSPRINTDQNGAVTARHDYHPFGEEIARTGYGSDTIRKQFTGYERDNETELDFAQTRYFGSGFGRFSSPDDFLNDSVPLVPQSWNKYAYARNNPLNITDPTGEKVKFLITVDTKKKTVTVTAIATMGIWSNKYNKQELTSAAKSIEADIEGKWKGSWKDGGWNFDFNAQVSVEVFDRARSTDDVLNKDPTIMNVVQLEDLRAGTPQESEVFEQRGRSNANNKNWSLPSRTNPQDGTKPDVAIWDYFNSNQNSRDSEPAHEFTHLLGVVNQGARGSDLTAPGMGQADRMSKKDFDTVVGLNAKSSRDVVIDYVNRNPNVKLQRFQGSIWRSCCR